MKLGGLLFIVQPYILDDNILSVIHTQVKWW